MIRFRRLNYADTSGGQPRRPLVAQTNGATKDDPRSIFGKMKAKGACNV
jgi:hypothetical protein